MLFDLEKLLELKQISFVWEKRKVSNGFNLSNILIWRDHAILILLEFLDERDQLFEYLAPLLDKQLRPHDVLILVYDITTLFLELGITDVIHSFSDKSSSFRDKWLRVRLVVDVKDLL